MEKRRILIADDESIIRMDLREMLTNLGYQVVGEASDGKRALALAHDLKPDLVIMDIRMPNMDGIEAARHLTGKKIAPVVFLTAFSQRELIEQAQEAGVVGYLVKPFKEEDLAPAIEVALARFEEFDTLQQEVEDLQTALTTRKVVDRAKGILMDTRGMTESEAFRAIQTLSMDKRRPMKEVAEAIIMAHEATSKTTRIKNKD